MSGGIIYFGLVALVAFLGYKKNMNAPLIFLLSFFLSPLAGGIYVLTKGNLPKKWTILLIAVVILPSLISIVSFFMPRDFFYNLKMNSLDYDDADGRLITSYIVEKDTYSKYYVPNELLADSVKDVGYVLEIRYIQRLNYEYIGGPVSGTAVHAKLIDCDTGRVIAENTFEPSFPDELYFKSNEKADVGEASVGKIHNWINQVYP